MECKQCSNPDCHAEANQLRVFVDWADLAEHSDEDKIVQWVNGFASMKEAQRTQGKRYRVKQQAMVKLVKQFLDPDEMKRIEEEVEESL